MSIFNIDKLIKKIILYCIYMETTSRYNELIKTEPYTNSFGDITKNSLIIILTVILVLSLLGVNIFILFGNFLQDIVNLFRPVVSKTLVELGYASGNLIDHSSDIVADTAKTGIDILHGTADSVGDLLIKASGKGSGGELDKNINQPPILPPRIPDPNETTNPIQSGNSSSKSQWCLVGEYNGTRGCVNVSEQDKCLSGQVFPNQQVCLNPNIIQNNP
jgi:hypothetical protein